MDSLYPPYGNNRFSEDALDRLGQSTSELGFDSGVRKELESLMRNDEESGSSRNCEENTADVF